MLPHSVRPPMLRLQLVHNVTTQLLPLLLLLLPLLLLL
jgi:hypothetical protein